MVFLWGRVYVTGDPPPQLVAKKMTRKLALKTAQWVRQTTNSKRSRLSME